MERTGAQGDKCYEAEAFDFTAVSDANGYFETESVFRFACCDFNVEISAEGYTTQTLVFYPRGEQWPEELIITLKTE